MSSAPEPPAPDRSRAGDWWTLAKPGITALICLVAVGGFVLARPGSVDLLGLGLVVGFGALASAGSGMLNHTLERERDRAMRRTRGRPLASSRVDPRATAAVGLVLVALGVGGASLTLNPLTGVSILLGAVTYVVVYTAWLKPRSSWNIVIGGFAGELARPRGRGSGGGPLDAGGPRAGAPRLPLDASPLLEPRPPAEGRLRARGPSDAAADGRPRVLRPGGRRLRGPARPPVRPGRAPRTGRLARGGRTGRTVGRIRRRHAPPVAGGDPRRARRGFLYSGPYLLGVVLALVVNVPLLHLGFAPRF